MTRCMTRISIDGLITTITERNGVSGDAEVVCLRPIEASETPSETTTAFLDFFGRRDVKTPLSCFWSDVGRTFWASVSRRTGGIEAQWVSSKFSDDSRSFARESMQMTL